MIPDSPVQRHSVRRSKSSSSSDYSDGSHHSVSTAPTDHSIRPSIHQYQTPGNPYEKGPWSLPEYNSYDGPEPQASCTSSISTNNYTPDQEVPPYHVPDAHYGDNAVALNVLAATPQEFADYFPSTQRICIRHDDSTVDGNMNLRVDTKARTYNGGDVDLTLFHLRMHDLKRREFSLRRYCRDSGREICHSSRKYSKPSVVTRPGLQRSMSSALSSFRSKSGSKTSTVTNLKRHDSGYDSLHEDEFDDEPEAMPSRGASSSIYIPTNTTRLEFSNYAHLEVKRRGARASKRYDLEYWGAKYTWKRLAVASGNFKEISYHLYNTKTSESLAHIVPIPQSGADLREESAKGGWVPPCDMMLEESVIGSSSDLADVIVASGLVALVDDCIKTRWHQKGHIQMAVPVMNKSPLKTNMEYVGPRRLVDEVFHKRSRDETPHPIPL